MPIYNNTSSSNTIATVIKQGIFKDKITLQNGYFYKEKKTMRKITKIVQTWLITPDKNFSQKTNILKQRKKEKVYITQVN